MTIVITRVFKLELKLIKIEKYVFKYIKIQIVLFKMLTYIYKNHFFKIFSKLLDSQIIINYHFDLIKLNSFVKIRV